MGVRVPPGAPNSSEGVIMEKFKIGDKVRVVSTGSTATVKAIRADGRYSVQPAIGGPKKIYVGSSLVPFFDNPKSPEPKNAPRLFLCIFLDQDSGKEDFQLKSVDQISMLNDIDDDELCILTAESPEDALRLAYGVFQGGNHGFPEGLNEFDSIQILEIEVKQILTLRIQHTLVRE